MTGSLFNSIQCVFNGSCFLLDFLSRKHIENCQCIVFLEEKKRQNWISLLLVRDFPAFMLRCPSAFHQKQKVHKSLKVRVSRQGWDYLSCSTFLETKVCVPHTWYCVLPYIIWLRRVLQTQQQQVSQTKGRLWDFRTTLVEVLRQEDKTRLTLKVFAKRRREFDSVFCFIAGIPADESSSFKHAVFLRHVSSLFTFFVLCLDWKTFFSNLIFAQQKRVKKKKKSKNFNHIVFRLFPFKTWELKGISNQRKKERANGITFTQESHASSLIVSSYFKTTTTARDVHFHAFLSSLLLNSSLTV